jgi:FAD/FMN-containing dehydrogenase
MSHTTSLQDCLDDLFRELGDCVTVDVDVLLEHGKDSAHHAPQPPDVVVEATSLDEVQRAVRISSQYGVPISPF